MNLLEASTCEMYTVNGYIDTSGTTIINNITDHDVRIVGLYVCNTTTSTISLDVALGVVMSTSYIVKNLDIPPESTVNIFTKDSPAYLPGIYHVLSATASATGLSFSCFTEVYNQ